LLVYLKNTQDSRPAAAPDEHLQELSTLKERVAQMTNRMGQMEQKVGCSDCGRLPQC
jgi:hypothetical protein